MSNLANQLKEQNALGKIRDVFAEIPRVRADLGYPPLVTPSSQIVGTQAVYNVLAGQRYKTITNEVKRYLQGGYGRPADQLSPELDKLRTDIGRLASCEEDVLTYAMFPDLGREFLQQRNDGTLQPEELLPTEHKGRDRLGTAVATEFRIEVHGESYDVAVTGAGASGPGKRKLYMSLDGMPQEVVFESLNEYEAAAGGSGRKRATDPGHVSTTMPGNVVDVLIQEGDTVSSGQAVLITEAMKMETEIHSSGDGTVQAVHVTKGDRVTPGEVLIEIA